MANAILTGPVITKEFLLCLTRFLEPIGKAMYSDAFDRTGARLGDTVNLRVAAGPLDFLSRESMAFVTREAVTLKHQVHVQCDIASDALTWSLREFSNLVIAPNASDLASKVRMLWPAGAEMVTAAMMMPDDNPDGSFSHRCTDPKTGFSVRCMMAYSPMTNAYAFRADMLFGFRGANYQPTAAEREMIALLLEARAELVAQREMLNTWMP